MKLKVATASYEELLQYVRTSSRQTVHAAIKAHRMNPEVHARLCRARDAVVEAKRGERPATIAKRAKESVRSAQIARDLACGDYKISAPCPGLDGYRVSPSGRVWSDIKQRFLSPSVTGYGKGYLHVSLAEGHKLVHRLVATAFLPNPENKPTVNHKDGNPRNNHVDNLEWATCKEQTAHALREGLFGVCSLTDEQVRQIRASDKMQKDLATEYGVAPLTISNVVRGKTYKHVLPTSPLESS